MALCAQWVAKDPNFLHADSKDSDQTGRMPRLIRVFAGRTSFCWFCHEVAHFLIAYSLRVSFKVTVSIYRSVYHTITEFLYLMRSVVRIYEKGPLLNKKGQANSSNTC